MFAYLPLTQKRKLDATGDRVALGWGFSFRATRRGRPPWVEALHFSWQAPKPLNPKPLNPKPLSP